MPKTKHSNRYYLAEAPIWRSLVHLCTPMMAGLSVGIIYNIINALFIGSLGDITLIAALTFAMPVFAIIIAIGGVFGVGGGTYISRLLGASEANPDDPASQQRIRQVGSFTFWGSLVGGVLIGALGLIFLQPLTIGLGAGGTALVPTMRYLGAQLLFTPVLVAGFALEQLVRAEGAAAASMRGIIYSTVVNLGLDALLILGLHLGLVGAGIAFGASGLTMTIYYAWWLTRKSSHTSIAPRWFSADRAMLKTVFGIGSSELIMSSFMVVTALMFNWVAVAYGNDVLAALGLSQRIVQLPEMLAMGVFTGAIPLLAYAFGASKHQRLRSAIRGAALSIAALILVFSSTVFLFRHEVFGWFTTDQTVIVLGGAILTAQLVSTLFNGFTGLFISTFQATEQVRNALIMSVAQGVLFIPMLLGFNWLFGLTGIIWSMAATEAITFVLGGTLYLLSRKALDAAPSADAAHQAEEVDAEPAFAEPLPA
ncbi:MAG: MATE family efflux transporter [Microbacteriaceae bacterium]